MCTSKLHTFGNEAVLTIQVARYLIATGNQAVVLVRVAARFLQVALDLGGHCAVAGRVRLALAAEGHAMHQLLDVHTVVDAWRLD